MRRVTSILLMIAFIILSASGVQMAVGSKPQTAQQQMISNPAGDKSMDRGGMPFYPKKAHEWAGFLFIGAGLVHLGFNNRAMLSYFRIGKK